MIGSNGSCSETTELLYRLNVQAPLDRDLLKAGFKSILVDPDIRARDVQLGSLLTGIMAKGPTLEEVTTLLECVFEIDGFDPRNRLKVDLPHNAKLVSIIGSGKKGLKTMNISTPACLIASSIGAYSAKSVSRSTSSITGSADLLEHCGMNINLPTEDMIKVIQKTRFGIFSIENLVPKFDKSYNGKFYAPHTLSFGLAALLSPVEYDNFIYGLAHPNIDLSIQTLKHFGVKNAMVVSATHDNIHYLDEFGIYGTTHLAGIVDGNIGDVIHFRPTEELFLPKYSPRDIAQGMSIEENVRYCIDVLRGKGEPAREDIICINAGTLLYITGIAQDLRGGYSLAKQELRTGRPFEKLHETVRETGGDTKILDAYVRK